MLGITFEINNGECYHSLMIATFKCKKTENLWKTGRSKHLPHNLIKVALRKLFMLDNAHHLGDLKVPPNNRLESLKGNRDDQWSIGINQQWRICFRWKERDAFEVEIYEFTKGSLEEIQR